MGSEMCIRDRLNAAGFAGSTADELDESFDEWEDSHKDLELERALAFDCWGAEECDLTPFSAEMDEMAYVFGEDWVEKADAEEQFQSFMRLKGTRLTDYFSEQLIALKAKVPEVATLMCNRAGIYE